MIVDAFIFYNEVDMLRLRLQELDALVDMFVLVEMDTTFVGAPKPSHFLEFAATDDVIRRFLPRIRASTVKGTRSQGTHASGVDPWTREFMQRNGVLTALQTENVPDEAIVMASDVDEIPRADSVRAFVDSRKGQPIAPHTLMQHMFYYSFKYLHDEPWPGPTIASYAEFRKEPPQHWRNLRRDLPRVHNGGWHCSYFGDVEFIKNKIRNFSHQDLNTAEVLDDDRIQGALHNGTDLFGRQGLRAVRDGEVELPRSYALRA